jgi:hypothetical protein
MKIYGNKTCRIASFLLNKNWALMFALSLVVASRRCNFSCYVEYVA